MGKLKIIGQLLVKVEADEILALLEEAVLRAFKEKPYPSHAVSELRTYTRTEAALKLKVSPNTISKYVKEGRLKSGGVGKYSFTEQELINFLEQV